MTSAQLYKIPSTQNDSMSKLAKECALWPRYAYGEFSLSACVGEGMLETASEEYRALQIIFLRPKVKAERYGAAHHINWKKVGITSAYFRREALTEAGMPTPRGGCCCLSASPGQQ